MFRKDKPMYEAPSPSEASSEEVTLEGPITLNLAEIRDEPVCVGWHTVKIERAEPKSSRKKGLPMIFFLSRVTDEGDPEYNRTLIWNCMLKGEGLLFTKRCFVALGMPEQLNYPSYQALADDLIGREVDVQVKHRRYKGEVQASVQNWRPLTPTISF